MNLVNRTVKRATQIFTVLERRLKSLDKKEKSSEVRGHDADDIHHKSKPPDSETTPTDITVYLP